mgnify:CR=1 FL=1
MVVDALKLLIKLTVQNLVFGKLGEASVGACNRIANYTAKHCNRSHMFLALISLSLEFPVKSQAQSLVVKMFSKTIRMEAKEYYLKVKKAYANIDDMSIYTSMHNLFEQELVDLIMIFQFQLPYLLYPFAPQKFWFHPLFGAGLLS